MSNGRGRQLRGHFVTKTGGRSLWRRTAFKVDAWGSVLGASGYVVRAIQYGISDILAVPFAEGMLMVEIPQ